ncbi:TonB C-terminal domain-containing protein [Sulfurimonas sp. C5]|uniref:TonB C-terminal domain-containing protein n=1 Tax=Sulfurimonas sp. C5 TaxID=3036947 RepID=UPI002458A8CE|nr:TonB C-terminal domain-containing protein [Sulfurimonas sp. C5]MDH4943642.1 TonB C-terminal domain-containing protein [Sulfurimonas sp. C5]
MVRDDKYFYISGAISLTIFFIFLFLFAAILFSVSSTKTYGLKKENYVAISLATPEITKQLKKTKPSKTTPTVTQSNSVSNNIDVNDLFSDVWTQKIDHTTKPKEVNSKRIQEISKRVKKSEKNNVESLTEKVENIDKSDSTQEKQSSSSADEVNEYLAKIQAIVYDNFIPPMNSEGSIVKIVIEIDSLGKMIDFRVLNYSSSDALNQEADKIKSRLARVIFPKNPDNRSFRAIINLIPENKE